MATTVAGAVDFATVAARRAYEALAQEQGVDALLDAAWARDTFMRATRAQQQAMLKLIAIVPTLPAQELAALLEWGARLAAAADAGASAPTSPVDAARRALAAAPIPPAA